MHARLHALKKFALPCKNAHYGVSSVLFFHPRSPHNLSPLPVVLDLFAGSSALGNYRLGNGSADCLARHFHRSQILENFAHSDRSFGSNRKCVGMCLSASFRFIKPHARQNEEPMRDHKFFFRFVLLITLQWIFFHEIRIGRMFCTHSLTPCLHFMMIQFFLIYY